METGLQFESPCGSPVVSDGGVAVVGLTPSPAQRFADTHARMMEVFFPKC